MAIILLLVVLSLTILCSSCQTENWSTHEISCSENGENVSVSEFPSNWSNATNVSIVLHCETVVLTKRFNISNTTNLYIRGANSTKILCSNSSSNIILSNINNLVVENIVVENCGQYNTVNSALRINACNHITVRNTTVSNSRGYGMIVDANSGTVTIENCFFEYNQICGLKIIHNSEQFVQITNCTFTKNAWGGMTLYLHEHESTTVIKNSIFSFNNATMGGGVRIKYFPFLNNPKSHVTFEECTFENNTAVEGGGISIQCNLLLSKEVSNHLSFKRCVWQGNSQALSLKNIHLVKRLNFQPEFVNCNFTQNGNTNNLEGYIFQIINSRTKFIGTTVFANNYKIAIEAVSSDLIFEQNSVSKFIGNEGREGAAIQLIGNTTMELHGNQSLEFRQKYNKEQEKGGAIYVDTYKFLPLGSEPSCFIRSMNPNITVNVTFERNSEKTYYNDVYTVSLLPCLDIGKEQPWAMEFVTRSHISTAAHTFIRSDTNDHPCPFKLNSGILTVNKSFISPTEITMEMHAIPGKTHTLQLKLVDELCHEVSFNVTELETHNKNSSLILMKKITTKNVIFSGKPGEKSKINLTAQNRKNLESPLHAYIDVIMDHCPPGFMLDDKKECACGLISSKAQFFGIDNCDVSQFQAHKKRGYWVGYYPIENHRQSTFASSVCTEGFCQSCSSDNFTCSEMYLPSNSSEDTSKYVCSDNRKGTICGTCTNNHSAYYHTKLFSCKNNKYCHLGWLFYILSEIIPVTILFLFIIFFNVSFTSGPLNGVILSIQIINAMKLNAEELIEFNEHIKGIFKLYSFVYQIFTLNFGEDLFSFCLFKGASALDMLAFRYVTIVYSLFLVIATILLLRLCSLNRRMLKLKRSIIHGLSAFLVMSYSECTRVSLYLLTVGILHTGSGRKSYVVFYNGDYPYMSNEHVKYALPAIFFLTTLVSIPPLLLLTYPLCYKLFALLKIEESKFVRIICKIIPLEKINPLFDSMQGAFKDQFRFFAGLYFLYRLCSHLPLAFVTNLQNFYLLISGQLVFMLFLHCVCRPYKNPWHNFVDGIFFLTLNVVNLLTFFNFQLWIFPKEDDFETDFMLSSAFQYLLLSLPLVYLVVYTVYCTALKFKCIRTCLIKKQQSERENSDYILFEIDSRK